MASVRRTTTLLKTLIASRPNVIFRSQPPLRASFSTAMSDKKEGITGWASKDGEFKRQTSSFRDHVEGNGKFAPEKGRYHLFVALACPWAHRALIVRKLKGLEDYIDVSTVHPHMLEGGWHFIKPSDTDANAKATVDAHDFDTFPGSTVDKLHGSHYLSELYYKADKDYNARFTVPVLWDTKTSTVVNNESSEVIRDLNSSFNSILPEGEKRSLDLYPQEHRAEIDELNGWVYDLINNGVYKSGFATTQAAYEKNVLPLFEALDRVEKLLDDGREFLVGGQLTEADVRLFTTIIRFDPVYYYHFKCNLGQIRHDYPNINQWMKKLYWNNPAFKDTTDFDQIKEHYTYSHAQINPTRIVPKGPKVYIEKL